MTARRAAGLALLAGALVQAAPARAASEGGAGLGELVWTAANLAILLGVLVYFGRRPIQAFFQERREGVQRELGEVEALRREVEGRIAAWQRKLGGLDEELRSLQAQAREQAEAERERILAEARAAAERIERDATAVVEQELRRSREVLRREAAELTVRLAGDLLGRQVTDADRERLLDEFIEGVEREDRAGHGAGR